MKKLLAILIVMIVSQTGFGQETLNKFKGKDIIVTNNGDTIFGNVKAINNKMIRYTIETKTYEIDLNDVKSYTIEKETILKSNTVNLDTIAPSYKGGELAMYKYLSEKMTYPKESKKKGIQGIIIVNFLVLKDGTISKVHVANSDNSKEELEQEAIKVVSSMPKWIPAQCNGECINVSYNLPINFKLK
ncbi:MAG: energy transducer TonB [Flavobacteriales bacterium]|nr:energy transducer TonB [Flavobacteriales bacterium]